MDTADLSPAGVERLRRSVAMLIRSAPALDREAAMAVLEELQRAQARQRELERGLADTLAELENRVRILLDR